MAKGRRKKDEGNKKILILGGSGFLGNAIYKELCNYFDTYGTYFSARKSFEDNRQFFQYDMEEDDVFELLEKVRPQMIISAFEATLQPKFRPISISWNIYPKTIVRSIFFPRPMFSMPIANIRPMNMTKPFPKCLWTA